MSLFPLISRGSWSPSDLARRFFDEDDVAGSFLDGELYDPPYYHQRFYIQPRNHNNHQNHRYHPHHHPHNQLTSSTNSVCPARQQGGTVACTPDKFAIRVDTRHFAPEEITVKTRDNCVVIHGKHEEKSDDRGCYVKREFTRRYVIPEDVDPESIKCHLTPNGLLALEAPRKRTKQNEDGKPIPIEIKHEGSAGGDKKK
uniref:SHSP domain-containing protein n=2 Tax=Amblyomma TaxID=6942 RepID=G3MKC9_AMBMU